MLRRGSFYSRIQQYNTSSSGVNKFFNPGGLPETPAGLVRTVTPAVRGDASLVDAGNIGYAQKLELYAPCVSEQEQGRVRHQDARIGHRDVSEASRPNTRF